MRSAKGSVRKIDNNRWKVCATAGVNPETGHQRRIYKTVRGSRSDAEMAKMALLARAGDNASATGEMTLGSFWSMMYLPDARKRLRPSTVNEYEKKYRKMLEPVLGGLKLSRISPPTVSAWLMGFDTESRRFEAYKLLRQVMNRAKRLGLVSANPCNQVEVPKKRRYKPDVLDAESAAEYVRLSRGADVEPAVLLAIGGGLRREEIIALTWDDISDGAVTIDKAVTHQYGEDHEDAPKSRFGERVVHLPRSIAERLEEIRGSGPVMQSKGERMTPNALTHRYERWRDGLPEGLPRITLKNLRHTSLTLALEGGADLLAVSRRAGHSNVSITSEYYLRPHDDIDKGAADGMDRLLGGS